MNTPRPLRSRRRALRLAGAVALAAALPRAAASSAPLRVGLIPYLSTRSLITLYEPLREHLERVLHRPVQLYSAHDFRALALNARAGEYDIALLPPHIARIAVDDWGLRMLVRFAQSSEVQLLALSAASPEAPLDLHGARIAAIDPLSLTALILRDWLAENDLVVGRDVEIVYVRSIASGLVALERGDASALVGAIGMLRDVVEGDGGRVRVLESLASIPTPAFVARQHRADDEFARLQAALLSFVPAPAGGGISRSPFVIGSVRDFDRVEPYAAEVRRLLAAPR